MKQSKAEMAYGLMKPRRWTGKSQIEKVLGPNGDREIRRLRDQYEIKRRKDPETGETQYRLVGVAA